MMNWSKGVVLAALLATPTLSSAAFAEPMMAFGNTTQVAATDDKGSSSEADKRAKAIDCSKQADKKKLHGAARKKFRESCKSEA